jgi:NhaP-type Na+/H+ or K+/H+ antiporter
MPRDEGLEHGIPAHQKALYALGTAFVAYGVAAVLPRANGLIAVFVAAITLGIRRVDIRGYFESQAEDIVEIVKLGIFVVFGSLLTFHALFQDGWAAVAIVAITLLVARPVGVFAALAGTDTSTAARAFMSWFGPKGVGTMTFSLLVLGEQITAGERIFNLAALVVFCSIIAHGLTDRPGVDWIERQTARDGDAATGARRDATGQGSSPEGSRRARTR